MTPTGLTAALKALEPDFSADPTVRAGPYGTFFYSFIAGTRATSTDGVIALQRFVDKNDDIQRTFDVRDTKEAKVCRGGGMRGGSESGHSSEADRGSDRSRRVVDRRHGHARGRVDKPWNAADVPAPWNVIGKMRLAVLDQDAGTRRSPMLPNWSPRSMSMSHREFDGTGRTSTRSFLSQYRETAARRSPSPSRSVTRCNRARAPVSPSIR